MPGSTSQFAYLDTLLFAVLPYVALILFFIVTVQRYRQQSFSYSSLSSQFLENDRHFWALVPFHYGILFVLLGHVVAFLLPSALLAWNGQTWRLLVLELTALVAALLALIGMVNVVVRRLSNHRVRVVTSAADWILYGLLFLQIGTGISVAVTYNWGSSWFAATMTPYLWSLVKLNPDISYVTPMPLLVKLHVIGNFVLIAFFPFTRLVHVLVVPNMYLWRKTQVVRWYGDRRRVRQIGREGRGS
jgi:nitrate reductase gamma subunit